MAATRHQVTFDFRNHPSQKQENLALLMASDKTFAEWDNDDDQVYDAL